MKNPPAEKFRCVHFRSDSKKGSVVTAGGCTWAIVSARPIKCVSNPRLKIQRKRSAVPLPSHLSAGHIASLCFHKSVTTEPSNATEGTGSMTKHLNKGQT